MKIKSKMIGANAGSGKTYQVVEHIAEICKIACPSTILCITFTKTGQKEMKERIFSKLANHEKQPKVVTFHGLCTEILSIFANEVGMPFDFEVSEKLSMQMMEEIQKNCLKLTELQDYIKEFNTHYGEIFQILENLATRYQNNANLQPRLQKIEKLFKMNYENSTNLMEETYKSVLLGIPIELFRQGKGRTVQENLLNIEAIFQSVEGGILNEELFHNYCETVTKVRANKGLLADYKKELKAQIDKFQSIITFRKTYQINKFTDKVWEIVEKCKFSHKKYTFDDIIQKTSILMEDETIVDSVLFTIAENVQHLVVDEAQDTNRKQWGVITPIIEEFKSNGMVGRSVFIVGDPKQTIYSFQGSEEGMMEEIFLKNKDILTKDFQNISYRTTQSLLNVINQMADYFKFDEKSFHYANETINNGFVQTLALCEKVEDEEIEISNKILEIVQSLIGKPLQHPKKQMRGKKIEPKDIVILCRKRPNKIIEEIRNLFKTNNIPISFSSKIQVQQHNSILDFIAILKLCLFKIDTLSFYALLKSPIFNKPEEDFTNLFNSKDVNTAINNVFKKYPDVENDIKQFEKTLKTNGIMCLFLEVYSKCANSYLPSAKSALEAFIENCKAKPQFNFVEFIANFENAKESVVNNEITQNSITFTTIHQSKGAEFPVVIYLDYATGTKSETDTIIFSKEQIPFFRNKNSEAIQETLETKKIEDEEESSNHHYVAITRASEKFYYICCNKQYESPQSFYFQLQKATKNLNFVEETKNVWLSSVFEANESHFDLQKDESFQEILEISEFSQKIEKQISTEETEFGIFVHKLFEDIELLPKFENYTQMCESIEKFNHTLNKVQKINQMLQQKLGTERIRREYEFAFNGKIIRLDVMYFLPHNEIAIVDFKTSKVENITSHIKNQLLEYQKAVEEFYKMPCKCYILWFESEKLEEI